MHGLINPLCVSLYLSYDQNQLVNVFYLLVTLFKKLVVF